MKRIAKSLWLLMPVFLFLMYFSSGISAAANEGAANGESEINGAETEIGVQYRGHIENYGNMPKPEGTMIAGPNAIGTRGQGLRVEGFWIGLTGDIPDGASINYQVHVQNVGWMTPVSDSNFAGTTGYGYRVESIKIWLEDLPGYDVYYRGHVQNVGNIPQVDGQWSWVKNGAELGTTGSSLRLEELQIKIVKQDGDLSEYDALLTDISKLNESDYWSDGWSALKTIQTENTVTKSNSQDEIDQAVLNIQKAYDALVKATIYSKSGTFGPANGTKTINGDVVIKSAGVTLQNLIIEGDLLIAKEVANGDVSLNNLSVQGQTYIRGGGPNSIHINSGNYVNPVIIEKTESGGIRLVTIGADGVQVTLGEGAPGEEVILEGDFESVEVRVPGVIVQTKGGTIAQMSVLQGAEGCKVQMDVSSTVGKMIFNEGTAVTGQGTIQKSEVNANGVTYEKSPIAQTVDPSVTESPAVTNPVSPSNPGPVTPSVPSAEDLLVAEFNSTKSNEVMLNLVMRNNLGLDLTGFSDLDYYGECFVALHLLEKDSFANKAAVQTAVTEAIKLAKEENSVIYMNALMSYTPNIYAKGSVFTITYPTELTPDQKENISSLFADLCFSTDTPLADGEVIELTFNGVTKLISNNEMPGNEILISKLFTPTSAEVNRVENQHSSFTFTVKDISTTVTRNVTVCPCTTKNGEKYFKNFTYAHGAELSPFWLDAYNSSITIYQCDKTFEFTYGGNLTDSQKKGLTDYYADTLITIQRPLVSGESITVSAMGKEVTLDSNTLMDNAEKTEIYLSKLMNEPLDNNDLAANIQGGLRIDFSTIKLNSENFITAVQVLRKGSDERIMINAGGGIDIYPDWLEEFRNYVSMGHDKNQVLLNYNGVLSEYAKTVLQDYQFDLKLQLDRELIEDESITLKAYGKTVTLTKDNSAEYYCLSDLLGIEAETAGLADTNEIIEVSSENLHSDNGISFVPILIKDDEIFYNTWGTNLSIVQPDFQSYSDSLEVSSLNNKFTVKYNDGLSDATKAWLSSYYADMMINLSRPLESDEDITINAFGKDVRINKSELLGEYQIRLSKLMDLTLGEDQLAINQTGTVEIAIKEYNLNSELIIYTD